MSDQSYDSFDFEHKGHKFRAKLYMDEDMGPPWKEHDGHGPVSDWTRRSKEPGERVLNKDRDYYRYYDFKEAVEIAKRDGWGAPKGTFHPDAKPTKGQIAAAAAEWDFEFLRGWCNDDWHWCGIVVHLLDDDGDPIEEPTASLWGIESESTDYIKETAKEVAEEVLAELEDEINLEPAE